MAIQLTQEDIKKATQDEQELADQAHLQHLNQRIAVLRAAVNRLEAENEELRSPALQDATDAVHDDTDERDT